MEEGLAYVWRRALPLLRSRLSSAFRHGKEAMAENAAGVPAPAPAPAAAPALHPKLQSVAFMLGTWRGEGEGGFPTIKSFKYGEEIKLWHVGKPVIAYTQKTWKAASGEPMHAESGYFRPTSDGSIEAVIAQSTGLAEVQKGTYDSAKQSLELRSSLVGNASKVVEIKRMFHVEGDELAYTVEMGTQTHELQPHLRAVLKKVSS
ncbi:THAP domain-containing protein 4 [Marchantia polymorpha subsp. ruderalis]|uniref:THAP4-like heme-binding domain-containing protein n=2 Tax=Marchantia polymorpha TaxID=3197 RepID=A0A176VF91_MARPO|nr:hypothetical protein AXG93_3507s1290 [Marchantia polymorpha subsp. ruderalis]PTQ38009.1 hypothetical protein MARPO_0054s0111 [Marchantia polymorpha]BBN09021.1 hypothetical protein Mp_4g16460 [Marchantia polymorpha subsp. ruderalis]|eukprot:PTQ38009.1 hypothetical protein MARPO_0054s0111 [Marchantia polymorpha]